MTRYGRLAAALGAALVGSAGSPTAAALEPGAYSCVVEHAAALSHEGLRVPLPDAPREFLFRAYAAPATPAELRREARPALDSVRPGAGTRSATIEPAPFATPTHALRSSDARHYVQGGVVWRVDADGRFLAYGPARPETIGGVAQFVGRCVARAPTTPREPRGD